MKRRLTSAALSAALGLGMYGPASALQVANVLFSEDFNSVALGDSVNERFGFPIATLPAPDATHIPINNVYSASAPNWTVDNGFNNFGNFDLSYDPDTNGNGVFDPVSPVAPALVADDHPPVGIIIGNTGVPNAGDPNNGVQEWEGWSFVNKNFWIDAAGDQDRSQFTNASGTVAVADPDEYDDLGTGRGGNYYNSGLTSNPIPVAGHAGSTLTLNFDSSWRNEAYDDAHSGLNDLPVNNQTAIVWASFDGSTPVLVNGGNSFWHSDDSPNNPANFAFKGDATNEQLSFSVDVPGGANSVEFTFGIINAANDWWWAIDNLDLTDGVTSVWSENFDSVPLGSSVNQLQSTVPGHVTVVNNKFNTTSRPETFTHTPPAGWNIDNTNMPGPGVIDDNIGVFEWEGWSITDLESWTTFGDMQQRQNFANAEGNFAVADGDEWDDLGGPTAAGIMDTLLVSPEFGIVGVNAGQLYLEFASSWRDEDDNLAVITVDYNDGNGPVEVLRWESDQTSLFFKDDSPNEQVLIPLNNPAGATTAKLAFQYQGGDDWWWAVDSIKVGEIPEPSSIALCGLSLVSVLGLRRKGF